MATQPDDLKIEQRHRDAAAWALDRAPNSMTWEYLTAYFRTPDQIWQANRVAKAFARFERDQLAPDAVERAFAAGFHAAEKALGFEGCDESEDALAIEWSEYSSSLTTGTL